jgi:ABC-type uncharacterized transport system substrate-binding protein
MHRIVGGAENAPEFRPRSFPCASSEAARRVERAQILLAYREKPSFFTVGQRLVKSLANPGANITGFINIEASLSGKWLELMRAVAPQVTRVGFLFNPQTAPHARYYLDTFRSAASSLAIEPIEAPFHNAEELETVMTKLGQEGGVGVIIAPDTSTGINRKMIVSLANRFRIPTIAGFRLIPHSPDDALSFDTDGAIQI